MDHLDAATLEEFQAFNKKFYMPNNAVLVVAGDFKTEEAKQWIQNTLVISKGPAIERPAFGRANTHYQSYL
jgi:predicted Zn-dependent peptidase